jgi:hypothetical protein
MNARTVIAAVALAMTMSACSQSSVSASAGPGASAGSASSAVGSNEVTLSGTSGYGIVAGDKVEIKDGSVFVNGTSYGAVPAGAAVKYAVNSEGRALFVGSERRNASK